MNDRDYRNIGLAAKLIILLAAVVNVTGRVRGVEALAQEITLARSSVSGGGGMHCWGGDFDLSGTIGQPDAGDLGGGAFTVSGGFWFPHVPADCNTDGSIDLSDFRDFWACMSGPDGAPPDQACACFDLDADGDVDLEDMGSFQRRFCG